MRGVVALTAALLLSLAMSGCFVAKEDPETQAADVSDAEGDGSTATSSTGTGKATSSGSRSQSATATGSPSGPTAAPVANLTASSTNGTAPFEVTFTVSATVAAGRSTTWVLEVAGGNIANGTTVPANVTHEFTEAGTFRVSVSVFDGIDNASANLTVTVQAPDVIVVVEVEICPTDEAAIAIPGAGLYMTPMDNLDDPPFSFGTLWIYEESNGIDGLQRNDDTRPTSCPTPDTIVF